MLATATRRPSSASFVGSELRSTQGSEQDDCFIKVEGCSPQSSLGKSSVSGVTSLEANVPAKSDKLSSLMIVFNTWNAMIGCGTVTIPWAFQ
mmetsp:Transcript_2182/g.3011  ORF Transcript_2182/g.3011 Transcript_2182/m.3011 type:complete len:92 (+) Transcript_2182:122-397(+)